MSKINMSSLDDDSVRDLFEEAFRARLNDRANNDIEIDDDSFECAVERSGQTGGMKVKVTVFGMAGGTTRLQFHDKKSGKVIKGGRQLSVPVPGKGAARFEFDGSAELNTNDYVLFYRQEG